MKNEIKMDYIVNVGTDFEGDEDYDEEDGVSFYSEEDFEEIPALAELRALLEEGDSENYAAIGS